MAFRLAKAACFAQGAWNIYILQPDWLNRKGVWTAPEPLIIETLRNGPGFRYSSEGSPTRWVVTPFQVTVETRAAAENLGPLLARLLRALPETPISVVGSRFLFRGKDTDLKAVFPEPRSLPGGEGVLGRGESVVVQVAGVQYALQLSANSENRQADLNVVAVPAPPACTERETAPHLDTFEAQRQMAQRLAEQYWKVSFDVLSET
jgi:hypothetical protein